MEYVDPLPMPFLPPPPPPPPVLPLPGIPVSIRATENPNAYLRLDSAGAVNLQLGCSSDARLELVLQPEVVGGNPVFAIKSTLLKRYVRLDPTVSAAQAPAPGTTFHPHGVGFTEAVEEVDAQCKFTVVPNNVDGVCSFSFKMVNPGTALDKVFLRLDTDKLSAGAPEVNGQTYIGRFERLLIEPYVVAQPGPLPLPFIPQ